MRPPTRLGAGEQHSELERDRNTAAALPRAAAQQTFDRKRNVPHLQRALRRVQLNVLTSFQNSLEAGRKSVVRNDRRRDNEPRRAGLVVARGPDLELRLTGAEANRSPQPLPSGRATFGSSCERAPDLIWAHFAVGIERPAQPVIQLHWPGAIFFQVLNHPMARIQRQPFVTLALFLAFCRGAESSPASQPAQRLVLVADVPLPGRAVRFDYQDIDAANQRLFITHMNDASVVVVSTVDGKLVKVIGNVPTPRGVVVAESVKRVFVTSSPRQLVIIDRDSLAELGRVATGNGPDGVAWDSTHGVVGVSDQADGVLSLIAGPGTGSRRQVPLGRETGNVVFDRGRALFWITVVADSGPNLLISVDPSAAKPVTSIPLPGCTGAHGLRLHPDGKSALVACEGNSMVARVDLSGTHALSLASSGADPDVLAIDPGLGWLYAAAESGDVRIFDLTRPGLVTIGHEHPGNASHSVAVDPATHRVFFPLAIGPQGTPALRIMRPAAAKP